MSEEAKIIPIEQKVNLTIAEIKRYICPGATDAEAYMFLKLCQLQNLNPFLRDAHLIKYGDEKAQIVVGKDAFLKRADSMPDYEGFKAGVILYKDDGLIYREGTMVVKGEVLVGGWAEVYRKGRKPARQEPSLTEYERKRKDGQPMAQWASMPATMIRKVALVQALREAFPNEFRGMYSPEEMPIDSSALPDKPIEKIEEPEQPNGHITEHREAEQPAERPATEKQKGYLKGLVAKKLNGDWNELCAEFHYQDKEDLLNRATTKDVNKFIDFLNNL